MNEIFVQNILRKQKFEAYFYPAEIFTRRILEERYRAHELLTSFCYLELAFDGLTVMDASEEMVQKSWSLLLEALPTCLRGSDVRGFLPDQKGLGILLLDSSPDSLNAFFSRLRQRFVDAGLDIALNSTSQISKDSFFYPLPTEQQA